MAAKVYREIVEAGQVRRVEMKATELSAMKPPAGFVPPVIALEDRDVKLAALEARIAALEGKRG